MKAVIVSGLGVLCLLLLVSTQSLGAAATHALDADDAGAPESPLFFTASASAHTSTVNNNNNNNEDEEEEENVDSDDDKKVLLEEGSADVTNSDSEEQEESVQQSTDVLLAEIGDAVDRDISDVETMLDTMDRGDKRKKKAGKKYRKKKALKKRSRRAKKSIFQPEPRDSVKILPSDPFAVPNPPAPKKKPQKSILSFDSLKDPLPYADKYERFKKVVDESDFAPLSTPKDFLPSPAFDPIADPLLKAEGVRPPAAAEYAFKRPQQGIKHNLFDHVLDFKYGDPRKKVGLAGTADNTWQSGEFKGMGKVRRPF